MFLMQVNERKCLGHRGQRLLKIEDREEELILELRNGNKGYWLVAAGKHRSGNIQTKGNSKSLSEATERVIFTDKGNN